MSNAADMPSKETAESENCEFCDGYGSISFNPNLNPNSFPASNSAQCPHCGGTGMLETQLPTRNNMKENSQIKAGHPGDSGPPLCSTISDEDLPLSTDRTRNHARELLGEVLRHRRGLGSHGCVEFVNAIDVVDMLIADRNRLGDQCVMLVKELRRWKAAAEPHAKTMINTQNPHVRGFVVELQYHKKMWIATWNGDPGRTCLIESARRYKTERGARIALGIARKFSPFRDAKIYIPNAKASDPKVSSGEGSIERLILVLQETPGITAATAGNALWAKRTQGDIVPARFARPAGALIARAKKLHLIHERRFDGRRLFYANSATNNGGRNFEK